MKRKLILVLTLAVTGACIFLSSCEKKGDSMCTCYDEYGSYPLSTKEFEAYGISTCSELGNFISAIDGSYTYCE
ncbi:MAG TPA: hypothetical protein IAC34_02220 [Candidatus Coprenecus stercoripullorum]|nr:hypothetical protein [Candidatus Coprenecus stercoripullorum]